MKKIQLPHGKITLVDDEDFEKLSIKKWQALHDNNGYWYVGRREITKGKRKLIRMHRFILSAQEGEIVDHINGDTFDNRKENLRLATKQQNRINSSKTSSSSGYKGVQRMNKNGKTWRARIYVSGKWIHLGSFSTPEAASKAYEEASIKHCGEFSPYSK